MTIGYSYIRFSSKAQAKGTSKKRQEEHDAAPAWCKANGVTLDTSYKIHDLGVSAFRGKNSTIGKLGSFLADVDAGRIKKGSVLIAENFDRISREEVEQALGLFLSILGRGIDLVTLKPMPIRFQQGKVEMMQLQLAIMEMYRAHLESLRKQELTLKNWKYRRQRMATGEQIGGICPNWLDFIDDGYQKNHKAEIVKLIFKLHQAGHGTSQIADQLNDQKLPVLRNGRQWSSGQTLHVLRSRQVMGEALCDGEWIKGYFPAVVSEKDFHLTQERLNRKRVGKAGPRGKHVTSLFTNILISWQWDKKQEKATVTPWRIHGEARGRIYIEGPRPQPEGRKRMYHLPYTELEQAILQNLRELDVADLLGDDQGKQLVEVARSKLAQTQKQLAKIDKALLEDDGIDALKKAAKHLEAQQRDQKQELQELEGKVHNSHEGNLTDIHDLIDKLDSVKGEQLLALRMKLKARISVIVNQIVVGQIVERTMQDKEMVLHVTFHNIARVRQIVLRFKGRGCSGGIEVTTESTAWDKAADRWIA